MTGDALQLVSLLLSLTTGANLIHGVIFFFSFFSLLILLFNFLSSSLLSQTWMPDARFIGGGTAGVGDSVQNSEPGRNAVYQTERNGGSFSYSLPVTPGTYAVTL